MAKTFQLGNPSSRYWQESLIKMLRQTPSNTLVQFWKHGLTAPLSSQQSKRFTRILRVALLCLSMKAQTRRYNLHKFKLQWECNINQSKSLCKEWTFKILRILLSKWPHRSRRLSKLQIQKCYLTWFWLHLNLNRSMMTSHVNLQTLRRLLVNWLQIISLLLELNIQLTVQLTQLQDQYEIKYA